jgi:uncharacterized protein (TIGR00661 family)
MNGGNFNIKPQKSRILLAPLDWGLGHATRCIPLVRELLSRNVEVVIAAEGAVQSLLQQEFPTAEFVPLRGYRIRYSKTKAGLVSAMLLQVPGILRSVSREKKWLRKNAALLRIDAVISDNRYGLYLSGLPCIFITHQLSIQTGNRLLNRLLQKINYRYINHFRQCWVPDAEGADNLAGRLSHPEQLPRIPVKYLGPLSRLEKKEAPGSVDLCVLISGPEPQRSVFERILLKELEAFPGNCLFIRGLPGSSETLTGYGKNINVYNHLNSQELSMALASADMVICRSGYTTVMDLALLGKKAILVPTPGQTEQEYLAFTLQQKGWFASISQNNLALHTIQESIQHFPFTAERFSFTEKHKEAIEELMHFQ